MPMPPRAGSATLRHMKTNRTRVHALAVAGVGLSFAASLAVSAQAQPATALPQGWTDAQRHAFYRTTQGSRLVPYSIFVTLETATSTARFAGSANLASFGYLFEPTPTSDNPDGLPMGFVKDTQPGEPDAFGLTCAACHTRDLTYRGTRMRVDGAPGYGDTERFLQALEAALGATLSDPSKFDRFRIANGVATGAPATALQATLEAAYAKVAAENADNMPPSGVNDPGFGRLDALAHIKNRVANFVNPGTHPDFGIDATAPANFPFLWDAPYLDFVQWPGTIPNWGLGSLGRNVGEVLGVFAETTASTFFGSLQIQTTANKTNLIAIENQLLQLESPQWPANLPAPDPVLAALGQPVFAQYCGSCHGTVARGTPSNYIQTFSSDAAVVGTDSTQADNNVNDLAWAGLTASSNPTTQVNGLSLLETVVENIVIPDLGQSSSIGASHKEPILPPTRNVNPKNAGAHTYKARPLNGIWATPPYLHDGSVRTLAELLLPGAQRETSFCVGSIEFSPTDVGLVNDCTVPNAQLYDTTRKGNGNLGHEYGTPADTRFPPLTSLLRAAVVEYLKTL
jgi:hypothetical protein